ncbi:hypothetical protein, partial [Thiolapillus sp.]|uniref:hypothetical protein n=1 Tax=Thiolapillus sp. TaxID=2017437 RepID=UPI003AF48EC7
MRSVSVEDGSPITSALIASVSSPLPGIGPTGALLPPSTDPMSQVPTRGARRWSRTVQVCEFPAS